MVRKYIPYVRNVWYGIALYYNHFDPWDDGNILKKINSNILTTNLSHGYAGDDWKPCSAYGRTGVALQVYSLKVEKVLLKHKSFKGNWNLNLSHGSEILAFF